MLSAGATVQREYIAMVEKSDHLAQNPQGVIKEPLMGPGGSLQPATTLYRVLHSNDAVALMQLTPKTGRKLHWNACCAVIILKSTMFRVDCSALAFDDSKAKMQRGS